VARSNLVVSKLAVFVGSNRLEVVLARILPVAGKLLGALLLVVVGIVVLVLLVLLRLILQVALVSLVELGVEFVLLVLVGLA